MTAATIIRPVIFRPKTRAAVEAPDTAEPETSVEATLVRRLTERDPDALRDAYDRHGAMIFGASLRHLGDHQLAEECTQDTFMALWRHAARIDLDRARLGTWLYVVARNRARSIDRGRQARPATPMADVPVDAEVPDIAELVARADGSRAIADALAALPDEQRQVVTLAYFHGLTQDEIATRLKLPLGTVKGRARLALDRLRTLVDRDDVVRGEAL